MSKEQVLFDLHLFSLCCDFLESKDIIKHVSLCTKKWNNWIKNSKYFWKNKCMNIYSLSHLVNCHQTYPFINELYLSYFDDFRMEKEEIEKYWPTKQTKSTQFSDFRFEEVTSCSIDFRETFTEILNRFLQIQLPKVKHLDLFYNTGPSILEVEIRKMIQLPFEWNQLISLKLRCTWDYLEDGKIWNYLYILRSTLKELILNQIQLTKEIIVITELEHLEKLHIEILTMEDENEEFFMNYVKEKKEDGHYYYDRKYTFYSLEDEKYPFELFPGYKLKQLIHLDLQGYATCLAKSFCSQNTRIKSPLLSLKLDYRLNHIQVIYENLSFLKHTYFHPVEDLCISIGTRNSNHLSPIFNFENFHHLKRLSIYYVTFTDLSNSISLLKQNYQTVTKLEIYDSNFDLKDLYLCSNLQILKISWKTEITEVILNAINNNLHSLKKLHVYRPQNGKDKFHLLSRNNMVAKFDLDKDQCTQEDVEYLKNLGYKVTIY